MISSSLIMVAHCDDDSSSRASLCVVVAAGGLSVMRRRLDLRLARLHSLSLCPQFDSIDYIAKPRSTHARYPQRTILSFFSCLRHQQPRTIIKRHQEAPRVSWVFPFRHLRKHCHRRVHLDRASLDHGKPSLLRLLRRRFGVDPHHVWWGSRPQQTD